MAAKSTENRKRGRPPVGSTQINVAFPPDELAVLDAWIATQERKIRRPEAIRRVVAILARQTEGQ